MRLLVQLEVELEVDEEILRDNNEQMTDDAIANSVFVSTSGGSFLSCMDEAIEVETSRVRNFSRIPSEISEQEGKT